jgi:hypothetical protein
VAYGALSGDEALSARGIVQKMQNKVLGLEKTDPNLNNLADLLLNVLPPEAVAMLLIEKKGVALIEMPFISPFPLHTSESNEPQTTPARVGLLIQGNKDIVSTVWKPDLHGENEPAKTVWTRKDLSLAEYRLIHRIESSQPHALFTAPSLAGAIMENGKQDKQQSLVFGYVHKQFPGVVSSNYHERKMNIAAVHQVMNFAIVAHKTFQHEIRKPLGY